MDNEYLNLLKKFRDSITVLMTSESSAEKNIGVQIKAIDYEMNIAKEIIPKLKILHYIIERAVSGYEEMIKGNKAKRIEVKVSIQKAKEIIMQIKGIEEKLEKDSGYIKIFAEKIESDIKYQAKILDDIEKFIESSANKIEEDEKKGKRLNIGYV